MPAFAFNVYPKGFGSQIQLQDAYGVGRTIVEQFRIRIRQFPEFKYLTGQVEGFSLLLYPGGRAKIEIESSINLKEDDFVDILNGFERLGQICCWRPCEPDKNIRDIQLKLLATNLREALPSSDPYALPESDWVELIHFIMNPDFDISSSSQRTDQILQSWKRRIETWCPLGIPLP
ncbi:MAG: hypothetical protein KAT65_14880, partial [Methanophagales archaeon]|nr:hypothetical protein [Methanophagales archaeon]